MLVYFLISILVNYNTVEVAPILIDRADTPQDLKSPLQLKRTLFGIIWRLELHLYDNNLRLDFRAPAKQMESTMESASADVLDDSHAGIGACVTC